MNLYGFAGGDPVNFSDPFGLCPIEKDGIPCGAGGAAIGAGIGFATGAALSVGCAGVTAGLCGLAAPGITGVLTGLGASIGGFIGTVLEAENVGGRTASGGYTDDYGNELGPSGKPKIHEVDHSTKKEAKDAARNAGKGAPVNHPSPTRGQPHFHPTNADGEKVPTSTHHNYPEP